MAFRQPVGDVAGAGAGFALGVGLLGGRLLGLLLHDQAGWQELVPEVDIDTVGNGQDGRGQDDLGNDQLRVEDGDVGLGDIDQLGLGAQLHELLVVDDVDGRREDVRTRSEVDADLLGEERRRVVGDFDRTDLGSGDVGRNLARDWVEQLTTNTQNSQQLWLKGSDVVEELHGLTVEQVLDLTVVLFELEHRLNRDVERLFWRRHEVRINNNIGRSGRLGVLAQNGSCKHSHAGTNSGELHGSFLKQYRHVTNLH